MVFYKPTESELSMYKFLNSKLEQTRPFPTIIFPDCVKSAINYSNNLKKPMNSVTIGRALEIAHGMCNFCQKTGELIFGEMEIEVEVQGPSKEFYITTEKPRLSWSGGYKINNYRSRTLYEIVSSTKKIKPGICETCIKDLAKQLNTK